MLGSQFNKLAMEVLKPLDNQYISTALKVFLILYASLIAPKLPENISKLLSSKLVRFVLIFLIAFISVKDPQIALLSSIGLIVSIMAFEKDNLVGSLVGGAVDVVEDVVEGAVDAVSDVVQPEQQQEVYTVQGLDSADGSLLY